MTTPTMPVPVSVPMISNAIAFRYLDQIDVILMLKYRGR
jgi:hypothetical protein